MARPPAPCGCGVLCPDGGWHALSGGICFGRPAHACVDREQWLRAHIIYLFTHLYSSPLGRAHAAEVLGGSAATTVYWSEGVRARSNFLSDPSIADYCFAHTISRTACIAPVCLREERRTPAVCSRFVWPAHPRLVVVVCCVLTGGGMHFLGVSALAGPRMHVWTVSSGYGHT